MKQTGGLWIKAGKFAFLQQEFLFRESRASQINQVGNSQGIWISKKSLVVGVCILLGIVAFSLMWANRLTPSAGDYVLRGTAWLDKKDSDRAIKEFDEAIRLNPTSEAHFWRGNAWLDKKNYDKAIADYDEAFRRDPQNGFAFMAYHNRGNAWLNKKEYEKAIQDYNEAIRLNPNADAHINRGNAWLNKKDFQMAIRDYDEAIRLNPKSVVAYCNRGIVFTSMKEFDNAMRDYDEAIRLNPAHAPAFNGRGLAWLDKRSHEKAIRDFDEAIRLDPSNALAVDNRRFAISDQELFAEQQKAARWLKEDRERRAQLENETERIAAHNRAIFSRAQKFVDEHPKIETRDFVISNAQWEFDTRPFRTKTSLNRREQEALLDFLGRAVKHSPYNSDPSFAVIIADLKRWDFTHAK